MMVQLSWRGESYSLHVEAITDIDIEATLRRFFCEEYPSAAPLLAKNAAGQFRSMYNIDHANGDFNVWVYY
jgi:hypothetical protein